MNDNYWILGGLLAVVILFAITDFDPIESSIPPTPAFKIINTTNGNVTASAYNDTITLLNGTGITITPNYTLKTITFTTSSSGGGENNTASNVGLGQDIFKQKTGVDLEFKGIAISGDLSISSNATDITISHIGGSSGEVNTQSSPTHANTLVLAKVGVDLPIKGIACGGSITCSNNSTDVTLTYTATGGGNATLLNDLGDVVLTSPSVNSIIQLVNGYWIDKIFSINSITGSNGFLLFGVSNTTGSWTQATIKNTLLDGSNHTDTISQTVSRGSIIYGDATPKWNELTIGTSGKVLSSDGTDISWQTPTGGSARESSVANWQVDKTWTNIGATFVNVYTTGIGDPQRIDTNGKTTASLIIDWTKVGAGTQKCVIRSTTAPNIELISFANLVSGLNTNATFDIPTVAENRIDTFVPMCKSTTAGDDPVFLTGQVLLR